MFNGPLDAEKNKKVTMYRVGRRTVFLFFYFFKICGASTNTANYQLRLAQPVLDLSKEWLLLRSRRRIQISTQVLLRQWGSHFNNIVGHLIKGRPSKLVAKVMGFP